MIETQPRGSGRGSGAGRARLAKRADVRGAWGQVDGTVIDALKPWGHISGLWIWSQGSVFLKTGAWWGVGDRTGSEDHPSKLNQICLNQSFCTWPAVRH